MTTGHVFKVEDFSVSVIKQDIATVEDQLVQNVLGTQVSAYFLFPLFTSFPDFCPVLVTVQY